MKIALLHYSFWPEIGAVEQVMRDQANMLGQAGHEVMILAGKGADPGEGYQVRIVPEMGPDFELQLQVNGVLERGQVDQNFTKYRAVLGETLGPILSELELTLVHNIFTLHHNLALTVALYDLAARHRFIAWTHDLAAGNSDYALPNPGKPPWSLMQMSNPRVTYVAVSERRAEEVGAQLKPAVTAQVIPNLVDAARLFGLTEEMKLSLPELKLAERDFVFLLPAAVAPRENIDFAIEIVKELCAWGRNPLLLITAPTMANHPSAARYGDFLRQTLSADLREHVALVGDFFPVTDDVLRDLYLVADCLLFPSARKGFGLPIVEATLFRLPIWCRDVPAYQALGVEGAAYPLEEMEGLSGAVTWLESLPTFRQQRRARALFDPGVIYRNYYEGLLGGQKEEGRG
jgi:glycosyltransferase involved in cell wall biosynthesis